MIANASVRRMILLAAPLAVVWFALTLPAAAQGREGSFDRTLKVTGAVDLDAHTSSGSIDSVHPVTMTVTGKIDKHRIQGKVRGGGPLVQVSCSSGDIRIR